MGITLEGMWIVLRAQIYYSDKLYFTILPLVIVSQKQVISKLPMSSMGYYAGKLMENAVYCFNEACVALTSLMTESFFPLGRHLVRSMWTSSGKKFCLIQ